MKKTLRSFLFMLGLLAATFVQAQLPSGSIAPDFTIDDLDGNEFNLYEHLDQGYAVVIDLYAVWCGPCWNYHQQHILEDLHQMYGPDGTNEVIVLGIEADGGTPVSGITGSGGGTLGDWTDGITYRMFDSAEVGDLYDLAYYPTIYTVCPSRIVTETGQQSTQGHYDFIQQSACQPATQTNDPSIIAYSGDETTCDEAEIKVTIQNFGTEALEACTIEVFNDGTSILSYDWTGSLDTYALEEVTLGTVSVGTGADLDIEITSADDNDANNSIVASIAGPVASTTHIRINLTTDNYPEETSWRVEDENGTVVAEAAEGTYANQGNQNFVEDVYVPGTGCYTFVLGDGYGDGLHSSSYGGTDGACVVTTVENGSTYSTIFTDNGANWGGVQTYSERAGLAGVETVVGIEDNNVLTALNVFPNPTNGITNIVLATGQTSEVTIDVINVLGAQVRNIDLGTLPAGEQRVQMDLADLEAGMYLVNITVDGNVSTTRLNLTK